VHNLICEVIYTFLGLTEFLGFTRHNEGERQSLVLFEIVFAADQLHHTAVELPLSDVLFEQRILLFV